MKTKEFLVQLDDPAIVRAIAAAEQRTSGEIRVYVSSRRIADPLARAALRFEKLGMHRTRDRNAVLLYFAPRSQKFAVVGDVGIHEKCGPAFWQEVVGEMHAELQAHHFTEAVVRAVARVGEVLARHFPPRDDDRDELANTIVRE